MEGPPPDAVIDPALQELESQPVLAAPAGPPPAPYPDHPLEPPPLVSEDPDYPMNGTAPTAETLHTMADAQTTANERQLNVNDALTYLDAVKAQFNDRPDVYNVFLDIMKEFKSQVIDTPGVIARVATLFHGHPALIQGFNTFLPVGYRIDVGLDALSDLITVTTPTGTVLQSTTMDAHPSPLPPAPPPPEPPLIPVAGPSSDPSWGHIPPSLPPTSIEHTSATPRFGSPEGSSDELERRSLGPAMDYVQRIKTRFHDDPDTYKQFLEILSNHKSTSNNQAEVFAQVEELFKDAPDLAAAFRDFLPGVGSGRPEDLDDYQARGMASLASTSESRSGKRKHPEPPLASSSSQPAKRKRKAGEKERERDREAARVASKSKKTKQSHSQAEPSSSYPYTTVPGPSSPRRNQQNGQGYAPGGDALSNGQSRGGREDPQFFDRVRHALDSRDTYDEFLKLVNLFTQDFIDRARLVRESRSFLGDGELMQQWKEILGWDENMERAAFHREREEAYPPPGRPMPFIDRPSREELNIRYGSYRKLPKDEQNVMCSGRDDMCKAVLNDEWISHPTFATEDAGFVAHKKNIYEDALHRSEEERHEYDFHIDGLVRTIAMLDPIAAKIAQLSAEERAVFKLKPNFGGSGKAIHQRIIKKIYGREAGLEVIQAMQETPALAIPVVHGRLKQKEEEWKRAQQAWNRVWREVDAQDYYKALDHQAISFKAADKKAFTTKAFVNQIEAAMEQQFAKRAILIHPVFARTRPRYQMEYAIADMDVLRDVLKLTFSYLARLSNTQARLDNTKRTWVETRLYNIVRSFFMLPDGWLNVEGGRRLQNGHDNSAQDHGAATNGASGSQKGKSALGSNFSGDLRKHLLKSEQAKSTRAQARSMGSPSPMASRMASPAPPAFDDEMAEPAVDTSASASIGDGVDKRPVRRSFFTNTWFYTLLRMIEVIYSRLARFKAIAYERANNPIYSSRHNLVAQEYGLLPNSPILDDGVSGAQYYELLLESCEKLFDNQIEQHAFEEQMRQMFGLRDAYKIFTIDKVLAAMIKHVQGWEQDGKLDKLVKVLWDERHLDTPTTDDHRKLRRQTEEMLGEENLFRIDWVPDAKVMTFQLLSKDGSSLDDAEIISGRWQSYVESFVAEPDTKGIPTVKMRRPYLHKSLPASRPETPSDVVAQGNLEIKVCVRTYRLFYVSKSEEALWKVSPPPSTEKERVEKRGRQRLEWLDKLKSGEVALGKGVRVRT
ncbi:hypothetical protein OF83DRAFT_558985 [Amylostereum chailletii]|nr:hypothetical protein OF83DRAFT_558985 [Amylostereum chailletii]